MFRNVDRMEGGPGDPKDFAEWWSHFRKLGKNVLLPLLIVVVAILLLSAVGSAIISALH